MVDVVAVVAAVVIVCFCFVGEDIFLSAIVGCCCILVPSNREPLSLVLTKRITDCGDENDFFFLFVTFDDAVVLLLVVFIDSFKYKVWSMSTSPRAN